jgi:hypothetical protein
MLKGRRGNLVKVGGNGKIGQEGERKERQIRKRSGNGEKKNTTRRRKERIRKVQE